jgi:hypothetical protein
VTAVGCDSMPPSARREVVAVNPVEPGLAVVVDQEIVLEVD